MKLVIPRIASAWYVENINQWAHNPSGRLYLYKYKIFRRKFFYIENIKNTHSTQHNSIGISVKVFKKTKFKWIYYVRYRNCSYYDGTQGYCKSKQNALNKIDNFLIKHKFRLLTKSTERLSVLI